MPMSPRSHWPGARRGHVRRGGRLRRCCWQRLPDRSVLGVVWSTDGSAVRLDGAAGFVLDADLADVLIVGARAIDGSAAVLLVSAATVGLRVERGTANRRSDAAPLHRLLRRRAGPVRLRAGRTGAEQRSTVGPDPLPRCDRQGRRRGGHRGQALEMTATYARERKPVREADRHVPGGQAPLRQHGHRASRPAGPPRGQQRWRLDSDPTGWATTADITSSYVGPACVGGVRPLRCGSTAGIGFTWEHDIAPVDEARKLDEVLFGSAVVAPAAAGDARVPNSHDDLMERDEETTMSTDLLRDGVPES